MVQIFGSTCKYEYDPITDRIDRHPDAYVQGKVYKARIVEHGDYSGPDTVAVKVTCFSEEEYTKGQFEEKSGHLMMNKWESLIALKHPNVVAYHRVSVEERLLHDDDYDYHKVRDVELVMDYYPDGSLAGFIQRTTKLASFPLAKVANFGQQIAQGLAFLHANDITLGYITPANILLRRTGRETYEYGLSISDLDARVVTKDNSTIRDLTRDKDAFRYMTQEMLANQQDPGQGADVWSLGVVLVDLLDCHLGTEEKWLVHRSGKENDFQIKSGSQINNDSVSECVIKAKILEGYVPRIPPVVHMDLRQVISGCFHHNWKEADSSSTSIQHERQMQITADELAEKLDALALSSNSLNAGMTDTSLSETSMGCTCTYVCDRNQHLGAGNYGAVYKATVTDCVNFSGIRAVKVVQLQSSDVQVLNKNDDNTLLLRWKTLLSLKHRHVIPYHKITIIRNPAGVCVEFLTDYAEGGSLASLFVQWDGQKSSSNILTALCSAMQITSALSFLHEDKHIIHGDLKPQNILCKSSNHTCVHHTLLVADLDDLVQMQRSVTVSQDLKGIRGTTRYMSPEMLRRYFGIDNGEKIGRKTDIWSLGCVFLEMVDYCYGNKPYTLYKEGSAGLWTFNPENSRLSELNLAMNILDGYLPLVGKGFPLRLTDLVKTCLQGDSMGRPSAKDVLAQLCDAVSEYCGANPSEHVTCRQHASCENL